MLSSNEGYIFSGEACIKVIFANSDFANKVLNNDFIEKYIPNVSLSNTTSAFEAEIHFQDKETSFDFYKYPEIFIGSKQLSERDAVSLIELVFERARQEKGIYCIHSTTVIYKNKAVIFWGGASGMGKTRLARTFVEKGAQFYSDEKTLIDLNTYKVVGGIPFQYLEKSYWKSVRKSSKNKDPYLSVDTKCLKTKYAISCFIYGFGIDNAATSVDKWTPKKFEWHLYEELGRKIRAISRRVVDSSISVQSIDSQKNSDKRIKLVKSSTKNIECYSIQGSPELVVNEIIRILKTNGNS